MMFKHLFAIGLFGLVSACAEPMPDAPQMPAEISSRDFVLLPCGPSRADRPCVLVVAGGKRILFGAPAGVAASLSSEELRQLDAVAVFSLRAVDIEGLDEVRNESWRAGRDTALLTIGPRGVLDMIEGLNKAYEQADALRIVEEGIPAGGYDAAILTGREARRDQIIFDTGDVQVRAMSGGYRIVYDGQAEANLHPCGGEPGAQSAPSEGRKQLNVLCNGSDPDRAWPLQAVHYVVRHAPSE